MKFWEKMGKKKNSGSEPELTPLERRLAEKAEKEENEANVPKGPKTLKEAVESISELEDRLLRLTAESRAWW